MEQRLLKARAAEPSDGDGGSVLRRPASAVMKRPGSRDASASGPPLKRPTATDRESMSAKPAKDTSVRLKGPALRAGVRPPIIVYRDATIYTSTTRRAFRGILVSGDYYSERSVAFGKDYAHAWERMLDIVDEARDG